MSSLLRRRAVRDVLLNGVLASPVVPERARIAGLRALGMEIGEGMWLSPRCFFVGENFAIGDWSGLGYECRILNEARVEIGSRTAIGAQTMVLTGSHELGDGHRRTGLPTPQPVRIGDGCWIGARVTILPGVTIGDGCVIGAGSLVAGSCAPHGIYSGFPAEKIRQLGPPVGEPPTGWLY